MRRTNQCQICVENKTPFAWCSCGTSLCEYFAEADNGCKFWRKYGCTNKLARTEAATRLVAQLRKKYGMTP